MVFEDGAEVIDSLTKLREQSQRRTVLHRLRQLKDLLLAAGLHILLVKHVQRLATLHRAEEVFHELNYAVIACIDPLLRCHRSRDVAEGRDVQIAPCMEVHGDFDCSALICFLQEVHKLPDAGSGEGARPAVCFLARIASNALVNPLVRSFWAAGIAIPTHGIVAVRVNARVLFCALLDR